MTLIIFLLILSFLVIIHELGHFLTAIWMKVKVEEFAVGYPPRALTLFKWRGIPFTLNWLPFGGFVKMQGEEEEIGSENAIKGSSKNQIGPFYSKSKRARLLILLAGVTINFIFGVIAFSFVYTQIGIPRFIDEQRVFQQVSEYKGLEIGGKKYDVNGEEATTILNEFSKQARLISISEDSPAHKANLPLNWNIVEVRMGEEKIEVTSSKQIIDFVNQRRGQNVILRMQGPCEGITCEENFQEFSVYARTEAETPDRQGAMGIGFDTNVLIFYSSPIKQLYYGAITGIQQSIGLSILILQAFGDMIREIFTHGRFPEGVSGPVGIVHQAGKMGLFQQGFLTILNFAGMLSINLAILNALPLPAFDGGRAVLVLLETVIGKKNRARIENKLNYVGLGLLITLMVLVTVKDVGGLVQDWLK